MSSLSGRASPLSSESSMLLLMKFWMNSSKCSCLRVEETSAKEDGGGDDREDAAPLDAE